MHATLYTIVVSLALEEMGEAGEGAYRYTHMGKCISAGYNDQCMLQCVLDLLAGTKDISYGTDGAADGEPGGWRARWMESPVDGEV